MSDLLVLTFADKPLDERNHLRRSCEKFGIQLKVLVSSPWIENVIKLKMLHEFVEGQDQELTLLIVDAYDVVLYKGEREILKKFEKENVDTLFSGESNFMYKEPAKWLAFLKKYPEQSTIYQYLNSGSYIGKVKHIKKMLNEIQRWFQIDLQDEEKLLPIKSDQYLLSRFYVENYGQSGELKLSVDSNQHLLGCTGGRFCVLKFPDLTKWQSFSFFILERNILKLFTLHKHQKIPKDFIYQNDQFYNVKMKTYPSVMHFPGTWDRFDKVYEELIQAKKPLKKEGWIFAAIISVFSFVLSIIVGPIFWLSTRRF
ncbi:MAG: glycosyltransferase domain-containing protein [Bacteroidota bacterium]